jgi:DNA repair protein RecO (recombination protein O)
MPLVETEAVILRTYRLGEADKIASLLTRNLGKCRAVASGAQRTKSRFGSSLEPLSYIRVWIFDRENRDLQRLNSAEVIESFFGIQSDYRIQVAAQYLAEVTEGYLPEREVNERVFRLLLAVLRALKVSGEITRPLVYFNYWLLRLGGVLPDLDRCGACRRSLAGAGAFYGPGSEALACQDCRTAATRNEVSGEALAIASGLRVMRLEEWWRRRKEPVGGKQLRRFFEEVIQTHLERKLVTRELLSDEI